MRVNLRSEYNNRGKSDTGVDVNVEQSAYAYLGYS